MNLATELQSRISQQNKIIVVIGDTMIDRWIDGKLELCQEGIKKFIQDRPTVEVPGGAANARRSISNWDVGAAALFGQPKRYECIKTRYLVNGTIVFRVDTDITSDLNHSDLLMYAVSKAGGVLLSDYDKGALTPNLIQSVVDGCRRLNIPCVADCKREPEVYKGCILKGNAEWAYRHKVNLLLPNVVITNGKNLPTVNGRMVAVMDTLNRVECVNHIGAGDCFAAHLTLALAYGFSLKEAAVLAHSAGRVYVQHPFNRPPLPDEIAVDLANAW